MLYNVSVELRENKMNKHDRVVFILFSLFLGEYIMIDVKKIKNGGAYLVDLSKDISPEITGQHYCYAFKIPNDKSLFLCFIMSSKVKSSNFLNSFSLSENPNGIVLLKHTKILSGNRFLNTLKNQQGQHIVLGPKSIKKLFNEYDAYLIDIKTRAIKAAEMRNKQLSFDQMTISLEKDHITLNYGDDYLFENNVEYSGGNLVLPEIDLKKIGITEYEFIIKDTYNQQKEVKLIVEILSQEESLQPTA